MAAELAAGLADGVDCPVCGATEHPRPAAHDGPVVTAADEQAAREVVQATETAATQAAAVVEARERELAALRGRAGELPVAEQLAMVAQLRDTAARTEADAARRA
jgi:exonuclease SbcC